MYSYFKGRLVEKTPTNVVLECNGVGYNLNISLQTYSKVKDEENLLLYAHLIVREDSHTLFGFASKDERSMFRHLITVSGIGANTARMILSAMSSDEIYESIITNNVAAFQAVKGIGGKTAQRIIIDLKDKVSKGDSQSELFPLAHNTNFEEALSALVMLGFNKNVANKALSKVISTSGSGIKVEDLVRLALKLL